MLELRQIDVASKLGVDSFTLVNWEKGATNPMVRFYPAIMDFLGYCPVRYPQNLGERIWLHRTHQGLTILEFANIIGVDECTLGSWERGIKSSIREARSRKILQRIFTS